MEGRRHGSPHFRRTGFRYCADVHPAVDSEIIKTLFREAVSKVKRELGEQIKKEKEEQAILEQIIKQINKVQAKQERLKNNAKDKQRQANDKQRLEEKAKEEEAEALKEKVLKQYHGSPRGDSTSDQSSSETLGTAWPKNVGLHFDQGEISEEARRIERFEDIVTENPTMPNEGIESIEAQKALPIRLGLHPNQRETSNEALKRIETREECDDLTAVHRMPNDLARITSSSFASSHNSSDVPNCSLIKGKHKTAVLHFNQQQSSFGSEVRHIPDADNSRVSATMLDGASQKPRFPHDINSTLTLDGPSQQTGLINYNNNAILEDPIVMPNGSSQETGELEMTSNGLDVRINIVDEDDASSSSGGGDDDDDPSVSSSDDDDEANGDGDDDDEGDGDSDGDDDEGDGEVRSREIRFPNGINNASLAFTGQAVAALVTTNSPPSTAIRLFAYAAGIGFCGCFFAAFFLRRHQNVAKTLFKIGVSASAFTVMIALGRYLPTQWYLNTAVPAVACLIIAVMVALSRLG